MSRRSAWVVAGGALAFAIAFALGRVGPAMVTAERRTTPEECADRVASRVIETERLTVAIGKLQAVEQETRRLEGPVPAWPEEVSPNSEPAGVRALVAAAIANSEVETWLIDEDCSEFPCQFVVECVRPEGSHGAMGGCIAALDVGISEAGSTVAAASGVSGTGDATVDYVVFTVFDPAEQPMDQAHRRMWMRIENRLLVHSAAARGE